MSSIVNSKVFRLVMGLCLLMQAVALLPHHHHGEDRVPCLNALHCIEAKLGYGCESDITCSFIDGHKHDADTGHSHGTNDGKCSMDDIGRQLHIDRDAIRTMAGADDFILLFAVFTVGSDDDECGHCHLDNSINLSIRRNRGVPSDHTRYIAEALPPRAPSFTA